MMKIAVLGGSFNPLHNGHVMLAQKVMSEFHYDRIFFVPTFLPPHKQIVCGASAEQRFEMVKNFCESFECGNCFVAEDCEIKRGGISYTYDTLVYLVKKYGTGTQNGKNRIEGKIGLIMGEEIACEFEKWKNPEGICELAELIIIPRVCDYSKNDVVSSKNKPTGNYLGDFAGQCDEKKLIYPHKMLSENVMAVSSTDIRNRIANQKEYKHLVPKEIYEYIEEKGIYKDLLTGE